MADSESRAAESKSRNHASREPKGKRQKYTTRGGLSRVTAYVYDDEERALAERAEKKRCSQSEIIRRALRKYLGL